MRKLLALALLAASPAAGPLWAQDAPAPPTPASIIASAPAADWRAIDPADLLVMTLAPDRDGNPRQVVIQLMPAPFSQGWIGNIRTLAKAHWWDGLSVYRVVDNWVAQWGDVDETKAAPEGLRVIPEIEYAVPLRSNVELKDYIEPLVVAETNKLFAALRSGGSLGYQNDSYSPLTLHWLGWPAAAGGGQVWPIHCYGHVGVARDTESTGTGSELYAVIGHAPRQLDRNIAVVGRVIEGIEHLSTLPRGRGDAGVYDKPELRVPIVSVRLGDELPETDRPEFEYLGTDTDSFARYVHVRANRNDAFYKVPAGGIDVCNVQVPIRRVPAP